MKREERIKEALNRGVEKVLPSKKALKERLEKRERLRIYQGFDPSMPSLHLGSLVGVLKLAQFQELGCEVIFLVGDFTGMIGDPTDKESARKKLSREKVQENAKTWKAQIDHILNFSGKNKAKIRRNSQWLDQVTFKDLLDITSNFTVQQMIQRDFFQKRINEEKPIFLHEFLYPVAQALDSVKMDVDVEIGGSDQMFNMLAGRTLLKKMRGKEKFILATRLLEDKEGKKVGKTTGNAVFLNQPPKEIYGKVMNFPDEAIIPAFELATRVKTSRIKQLEKELKKGKNPMNAKKELAFEITKLVHSEKEAGEAQKEFERVFQEEKLPEKIKEIKIEEKELSILDLLVKLNLCSSKSEAKRMVEQNAVKIDGEEIKNWKKQVRPKKGAVVQVGKRRFAKVAK